MGLGRTTSIAFLTLVLPLLTACVTSGPTARMPGTHIPTRTDPAHHYAGSSNRLNKNKAFKNFLEQTPGVGQAYRQTQRALGRYQLDIDHRKSFFRQGRRALDIGYEPRISIPKLKIRPGDIRIGFQTRADLPGGLGGNEGFYIEISK